MPEIGIVLAAAGLVAVHRRGVRADRADGLALRGWGFAAGLLVATLAVAPAVEVAAERSFVWHMAQHQLLLLVAAPLIATSAPLRSIWTGVRGRSWRGDGALLGPAGWVLPAALVAVAVLVTWHVPAAYDVAMARPPIHLLEHATLLGSAVALWATVLHAARDPHRLGLAVVALAGTAIAGAALGVVLLTAPQPLYAAYADAGPVALEQQQVGGALMKVGALLVHAVAAVAVTLRWLHRLEGSSLPASR